MSVNAQKLELIEWILKVKDAVALDEMMKVKRALLKPKKKARKFGSGKHIFTYVADDFDAPLPEFEEYMK